MCGQIPLQSSIIPQLLKACPEFTVHQLLADYSLDFVEGFSMNYLAPFPREGPIPRNEVEACRVFAERLIVRATGMVNR